MTHETGVCFQFRNRDERLPKDLQVILLSPAIKHANNLLGVLAGALTRASAPGESFLRHAVAAAQGTHECRSHSRSALTSELQERRRERSLSLGSR